MADINLLNSEHSKVEFIASSGSRIVFRLAILLAIAVFAYYGYLFLSSIATRNNLVKAQTKVDDYTEQINQNTSRQELLTRQGQLNSVNLVLSKHLLWSELLPELARVTVRSAKYTNISVDQPGTVQLSIEFPNYAEADKYLQVFNLPQYNKYFSNVRVASMVKSQSESGSYIAMLLDLTYDESLLKPKSNE
ncbi:MAG: hypothetical protein R3B41_04045 [Candidatus Doudnabacteria bacterium]